MDLLAAVEEQPRLLGMTIAIANNLATTLQCDRNPERPLEKKRLVERLGVAANTVSRFENGSGAMVNTLERMQTTLESGGVVFNWRGPAMKSRRLLVAATAALLGGAALAVAGTARAAEQPVTVTVDTRAGLGTVPALGLGVNHAIWDTELGSDATSTLMKNAGVQMVRYPGGSYADIYHWETHTAPGGYVAPNTDFDTFMAGAKKTGAQPVVIANYGTGTAEEAAGWVHYANKTKKYGVKYWEIGNENYGNGHYGTGLGGRPPPRQEPERLRHRGRAVRRGDEGGRPHDQDRGGAHHAGRLAGRHRRGR